MRTTTVAMAVVAAAVAMPAAAKPRFEPTAVVFVIDRSGSMQGAKLDTVKDAVKGALDGMDKDKDQAEVVTFDSEAAVQAPMAVVKDVDRKAIAAIAAGGGTNFFPALQAARKGLAKVDGKMHKHVVLLTDGEAPDEGIHDLVAAMAKDGITVSAMGIAGADRNILSMIAEQGHGTLYMVDDMKTVAKVMAIDVEGARRAVDSN